MQRQNCLVIRCKILLGVVWAKERAEPLHNVSALSFFIFFSVYFSEKVNPEVKESVGVKAVQPLAVSTLPGEQSLKPFWIMESIRAEELEKLVSSAVNHSSVIFELVDLL